MQSNIPAGSPANYLKPGEWQFYCPSCTWGAPINAVGIYHKCESCGSDVRLAEVSPGGVPIDRSHEEAAPRLGLPAVTKIDGKWDEAASHPGAVIDIGNLVACDDCGDDYTESRASGGYIWHNRATCPACADRVMKTLATQKLLRLMKNGLHCPSNMSFADFVRAYRGDNNTISLVPKK